MKKQPIEVTMTYIDRDGSEQVYAISRLQLVGLAGMACTHISEALAELENKSLGGFLSWEGELAHEGALPASQPSLALALETLRRFNEDRKAALALMEFLRPRNERKKELGHEPV